MTLLLILGAIVPLYAGERGLSQLREGSSSVEADRLESSSAEKSQYFFFNLTYKAGLSSPAFLIVMNWFGQDKPSLGGTPPGYVEPWIIPDNNDGGDDPGGIPVDN